MKSTPRTQPIISPPPAAPTLLKLAALFFCSGALALIYEVIWQRQFALVFGSAAPATAAVLASYFTGLGAGSLGLGALARKWTRPLRVYAALEILIGLGALLVTPLLNGFEKLYPWLFDRFATQPGLLLVAKALLAFAALAVPTFCMGGTLPALGQLFDFRRRELGMSAGLLYATNTAGAALGALSVPFVLLPMIGARATVWLCAGGNVLIALAAWWMDRSLVSEDDPKRQTSDTRRGEPKLSWRQLLLVLSFVSGLLTFALQVQWNRAFAQVHENSLYSFAVIVAVFILALAAGAQLARTGLRRQIAPHTLVGAAWMLGGILVLASPWLFVRLTDGLAFLPSDGGWIHLALRLVGIALAVLFVPVTLLGVALPALMEQAGRDYEGSASDVLGRLLAVNVIGSVAGALLAGFVLPRWLGLWNSILFAALVLVIAGGWQFEKWRTNAAKWKFRLVLAVSAGLVVWFSGTTGIPRVRLAQQQGEFLVTVAEGTHGIVAVVERPGSRRLKLNNHYVLGGTTAAGDERMQAHLPLLLHPSPRQVAVLGLGTGITAGGALFHPVENLTAVELVPEVVTAAREHFDEANAGLFRDARTRVIIEDARNYLRASSAKFDVIIGDLVVPWRQGEGALFTLEHFLAARQALAPGGLFCQWLPLFQLSEPELNILLRTFLSVFPRAQVWRGDFSPTEPAIALVGGLEPFALKPAEVTRRLREMRSEPTNPHLAEPIAFWMYFAGILGPDDLAADELRVNREDRPWIELIGPIQHTGQRGASLCTGRRLQRWLNEVKQRSIARIANLGEVETAGSQAGDLLFEFTLLLSERNEAGARAVHSQLRSALPEEVFKTILPENPSGTKP